MKTTIYLIRHSEKLRSEKQKVLETAKDSQMWNEKIILSVEGEKKAAKLAKRKELQKVDVLYCSHYARALGTAKYIAENRNIEINVSDMLGERKVGRLEELEKFQKVHERIFTKEQLLDIDLKLSGGESRREVIERANLIIDKIITENPSKNIAIVAHACFFKHYLSSFCDMDENFAFSFKENTIPSDDILMPCIIEMIVEDGKKTSIKLLG